MGKGLKLFLVLSANIVGLTSVVYLLMFALNKSLIPDLFVLIPAYFMLASAMLAGLVAKVEEKKNFLTIPILLGFRMLVAFVGLIFLIIGIVPDRVHILPFTLIFVFYYLIFSIVETRILVKINKK